MGGGLSGQPSPSSVVAWLNLAMSQMHCQALPDARGTVCWMGTTIQTSTFSVQALPPPHAQLHVDAWKVAVSYNEHCCERCGHWRQLVRSVSGLSRYVI